MDAPDQSSRFFIIQFENLETGLSECRECSDVQMLKLLLRQYGTGTSIIRTALTDLAEMGKTTFESRGKTAT